MPWYQNLWSFLLDVRTLASWVVGSLLPVYNLEGNFIKICLCRAIAPSIILQPRVNCVNVQQAAAERKQGTWWFERESWAATDCEKRARTDSGSAGPSSPSSCRPRPPAPAAPVAVAAARSAICTMMANIWVSCNWDRRGGINRFDKFSDLPSHNPISNPNYSPSCQFITISH